MPENPKGSTLCYGCLYRRDLPGDAHSSCSHPVANLSPVLATGIIALSGRLSVQLAEGAQDRGPGCNPGPWSVRVDEHGLANGWAAWPINFDPIWIRECSGHSPKEALP